MYKQSLLPLSLEIEDKAVEINELNWYELASLAVDIRSSNIHGKAC